ncbi:MAG: ABC transporter permease subunit [Propionibacteriales bacterium]|nr:ABC transporter permease subunit [Propionibacteriales bacterium]
MSDPAMSLQEGPPAEQTEPAKDANRSLWGDAWYELKRNPIFWVASTMAIFVILLAVFPFLWTNADPSTCRLANSREKPSADHWFGYTFQGCDMWAKVVYGASKSLAVAALATTFTTIIGITMGTLAGFFPGWVDTIISRVTDIFFGLPFLLGAVVFLQLFQIRNVWTITTVLTLLGWTTLTRIMRGSVLSTKNKDYVDAARALGATNGHIVFKHILPNAIAPVFVLSTIALGGYIGAEATLTFLGVGFQQPNTTWGLLIQEGQPYALQGDPHLLVIPCAFVVVTVLAFILLGDALRDALDPRNR